MKEEEVEIRSEEIMDFMAYTPSWLVGWGISTIFFIIIIVLLLASIIRYPETITGQAIITTVNPTVTIVNKVTGRLEKILLKDESTVKSGDVIAEVESPANAEDVNKLRMFLNLISANSSVMPTNSKMLKDSLNLGDFQSEYSQLVNDLKQYSDLKNKPFYQEKIKLLTSQIANQKGLFQINQSVIGLYEKEVENSKKKYEVFKKLFEEKVVPALEFQDKQDEFGHKQQEYNNLKKGLVQNQISITDLERQKVDLSNEFSVKENMLVQSILQRKSNLTNSIINWQKSFIIKAQLDGKLKYIQNLTEKQFVKSGEPLFLLVPPLNAYMGIITVPSQSAGKLKIGQKVLVLLDSYPVDDYGKLVGKITKIYAVSNQNSYTIQIAFPRGLISSLHKVIPFKPQMGGIANIILDNTTITERLLKKIRVIQADNYQNNL